MIRVGVLGAGSHSRREHLPALALYAETHPGTIDLTALCDRQINVAAVYGFGAHCETLDALLALRPDAIIAVTPAEVTADLAVRIMSSGIPLLMEKPLGQSLDEARRVVTAAEGRQVMVSMNRRFDPAIRALDGWLRGQRIEQVRATVIRRNRERTGFTLDVGIHAVDTLRFLVNHQAEVRPGRLAFTDGAIGTVELRPDGGHWEERYEVFGPGFHVQAFATGQALAWHNGEATTLHAPQAGVPSFVSSGTYAETEAFVEALTAGRSLHPRPGEVLESMAVALDLETTP